MSKYNREELMKMSDEEYDKAMAEIREEAETKGKEKLRNQIAREKRLVHAISELWKTYELHGDGKIKVYIKEDIERAVRAGIDTGEE